MKRKKFKNDIEKLKLEGRLIMESSADSRFYNRVAAVNAVLSGVSPTEASVWFGMTRRTLAGWVKKVDDFGFDALADKPRSGARPRLNAEQLEWLDHTIQVAPSAYGFKVWDGTTLSVLIKQEFAINLGTRQCQRLFHKLGYARIRPHAFPSKGCERSDAREEFQKKDSR